MEVFCLGDAGRRHGEARGKRNGCTKVVPSPTTYFLLAFPLLWILDKYNELVNSAESEAPG